MTEKLYYQDPYRTEFSARLVSQQKSETDLGPRWRVVLSATCFYPAGGGQPSDLGTLNEHEVTEVLKEGDEIVHLLEDPLDEADAQDEVVGRLEPMHRRHYMQQHSGQHLISAVLARYFNRATVSVHLGDESTSIEAEGPELSEFEIVQLEDQVNRVICENRPIHGLFVGPKELKQLKLRRSLKAEENIRLVEIADMDLVGCGGVHLERTGEIRLIKHVGTESVRGNSRYTFLIGDAAMADYRSKSRVSARLSDILSAPPAEHREKLDAFESRSLEKDREISTLKRRVNTFLAEELYRNRRERGAFGIVASEIPEESADQLREIAQALQKQGPLAAALITRTNEELRWVLFVPEEHGAFFQQHREELLRPIAGKGGGRPPFWQGAGTDQSGLEEFLTLFHSLADKL